MNDQPITLKQRAQQEINEIREMYDALSEEEKQLVNQLFGDLSQLPKTRGTNKTPKKKKRKK